MATDQNEGEKVVRDFDKERKTFDERRRAAVARGDQTEVDRLDREEAPKLVTPAKTTIVVGSGDERPRPTK